MIEVSRRSLLTGIGSVLITAPAIVRISSLMAVKAMPAIITARDVRAAMAEDVLREITYDAHARMVETVRRAFLPRLYVQIYEPDLKLAIEKAMGA